jgi:hypothetical protein
MLNAYNPKLRQYVYVMDHHYMDTLAWEYPRR